MDRSPGPGRHDDLADGAPLEMGDGRREIDQVAVAATTRRIQTVDGPDHVLQRSPGSDADRVDRRATQEQRANRGRDAVAVQKADEQDPSAVGPGLQRR